MSRSSIRHAPRRPRRVSDHLACRAVLCYAVSRLVELNQESCASEDITAQVEKLTKEVVSGQNC